MLAMVTVPDIKHFHDERDYALASHPKDVMAVTVRWDKATRESRQRCRALTISCCESTIISLIVPCASICFAISLLVGAKKKAPPPPPKKRHLCIS